MQEVRKSQNQDLRADPSLSINSGKVESNPADFFGFRRLRAACSSGRRPHQALMPHLEIKITAAKQLVACRTFKGGTGIKIISIIAGAIFMT